MNNLEQLRRVSFAPTEASRISPQPRAKRARGADWRNSDTIYPATPAHIARIRQMPAANQPMRAARIQPAEPQVVRPKRWRANLSIAGVFLVSVGVVAGLISIAAFGVFGLVAAVGAAILGASFIKIGKMD